MPAKGENSTCLYKGGKTKIVTIDSEEEDLAKQDGWFDAPLSKAEEERQHKLQKEERERKDNEEKIRQEADAQVNEEISAQEEGSREESPEGYTQPEENPEVPTEDE